MAEVVFYYLPFKAYNTDRGRLLLWSGELISFLASFGYCKDVIYVTIFLFQERAAEIPLTLLRTLRLQLNSIVWVSVSISAKAYIKCLTHCLTPPSQTQLMYYLSNRHVKKEAKIFKIGVFFIVFTLPSLPCSLHFKGMNTLIR